MQSLAIPPYWSCCTREMLSSTSINRRCLQASFSMMHGTTEQESTDDETTLRMFRALGSGSTPGKIYKKSPALNGSRRRSDSNELGSFPQKYLRIYKRLAKSGRTDSSAPPPMPEPDYIDNVEETPSPDCDEAKFGLDSGLESESSSSSCTGFNTSELDSSAVSCRWQLPSSSLYNVSLVDTCDMETLRRSAQRHRMIAAKLLPRMERGNYSREGAVLHARTASKDSSSGGSISPKKRLLPFSCSSSSSITTESGIASTQECSCYGGEPLDSGDTVLVDRRFQLDTDRCDSEDSVTAPSTTATFADPLFLSGNGAWTNSACTSSADLRLFSGDDDNCPSQLSIQSATETAAQTVMSSSNLVYAVPVKPRYDSSWTRDDGLEMKKSVEQSNGINCVEAVLQQQQHGVEDCRLMSSSSSSSSPQTVPKRTVVPVYPFQPQAHQRQSSSDECFVPVLKPGDAPPVPRKPIIVNVDCQGWESSSVDHHHLKSEKELCAEVDDCGYDEGDALCKPLDVILSTLMNNALGLAKPLRCGAELNDADEQNQKFDNTLIRPNFVENAISVQNTAELEKEKFDLISRLSRKLKVLKEEKRVIEEEIKTNESMGTELLAVIAALDNVSIAQKEKVAIYVEDVDKITRLLLKLASQFRRVGRILSRAGDNNDSNNDEEMLAATKRHAVLLEQLEDAKELKEDLHRRGGQLAKFLTQMLTEEQLVDYQYFIRMKSKLLAETQEIEEKILLGEEQKEGNDQMSRGDGFNMAFSERLARLDEAERNIVQMMQCAGQCLAEVSKDKTASRQAENQAIEFLRKLALAEKMIDEQLNYLGDVGVGAAHEGSSYSQLRYKLMAEEKVAWLRDQIVKFRAQRSSDAGSA
ncbi:Protein Shroom4 [Trichinella pseudospiralis]|uniref:Mediator of RNA polymerase II transcription subunit 11 n=1 Tax=Trichinella pseudospiralis TaxID=6337 RepID=A0A0V1K7S1_TRIPS|nr:Protein Shroom4 [Trichinella pseudospiralis]